MKYYVALCLLLFTLSCNETTTKTPSLTLTPTTATVTAGSGAVSFKATLSNVSGEVAWTLEPNLGTLSSNKGLEVSYTPPASIATQTTVTLTAASGNLSAKATITINPASGEDKTPPSTVSLSPEHGAKNVANGADALVTFSEAVKADTVTGSSVKVNAQDGSAVSKFLRLSSDGKTLTIDYQSTLQLPEKITITLGPTITDLAGNALQTTPWSFDVPVWQTLSDTLDITVNNFAFEPSMATGNSDNPNVKSVFVAWYEQDQSSSQNRVYVKHWDGNTWQQLGDALNTTSANSASDPSLVVDSENRPIVAFQETDSVSGDSSIYVKRWGGSTWVSLGSAVATGSAEHPSLAMVKDTLGIAFANTNGTNKAVYFKLFTGTTWEALGTELNDVKTQNADFPSLDMIFPPGTDVFVALFVAFEESDGFSNNIYVKTWDETTLSWVKLGDELDVNVAKEARHPSLRLFSLRPAVAWQEDGSTNGDIYVKQFNGATWDALGDDDYKDQDASEPFIATLPNILGARSVVVWRGNDSKGQNVYAKTDSGTGSWLPIPETGLVPFNTLGKAGENPVMALAAFDAYVAFAQFDSNTNSTNIVVKRYNLAAPDPQ